METAATSNGAEAGELPVIDAQPAEQTAPARPPADPKKLEIAASKRAVTRISKKLAKAKTEEEFWALVDAQRGREDTRKASPAVETLEAPKLSSAPPPGWPTMEARAEAMELLLPLVARLAFAAKGTAFDLGEPIELEVPTMEFRDGKQVITGAQKMRVDPVVRLAQGVAPFVAVTAGESATTPGALALITVGTAFGPGLVKVGAEVVAPKVVAWWSKATEPKKAPLPAGAEAKR